MSSKLLKPHALKKGDCLGIAAFASAVQEKVYKAGLEYIKSQGFKYKVELNPVFRNYKHLFSPSAASERSKAFTKLLNDSKVSALLSARGGYGSAQMLPDLNFKLAAKKLKPVVGFSDITALLTALYSKSNLVTIHGPSMLTFGARALEGHKGAIQSLKALQALLKGEIINPFEKCKLKSLKNGKKTAEGRLIGGNLSILNSMIGTPWEANFKNHILFLEEVGEAPYRVHRLLLQLKQAGKFEGIKALLIGDFTDSRGNIGANEPGYEEVFKDIFAKVDFPVLSGLPIGHGDINLPIPIGVKARINQNRLEILEPAVIS